MGGDLWQFDGTMLVRSDSAEYEYDEKGRLVGRVDRAGTWRFNWDAEDRLVEAITPTGDRWRYRDDGFGRRIAKQRLAGDDSVLEQSHSDANGITTTTSWDYRPGGTAPVTQVDADALHTVLLRLTNPFAAT